MLRVPQDRVVVELRVIVQILVSELPRRKLRFPGIDRVGYRRWIRRVEAIRQRAEKCHDIVDFIRCESRCLPASECGRRIRNFADIDVRVEINGQIVVLVQISSAVSREIEAACRLIGIAARTGCDGIGIVARVVVDVAGDIPLDHLTQSRKYAVVKIR